VKEIGGNVTAVRGDVAKLADLDKLYDIVRRTTGRVDIEYLPMPVLRRLLRLEKSRKSIFKEYSISTSRAWCSQSRRPCH
jgi:hypothetical protein